MLQATVTKFGVLLVLTTSIALGSSLDQSIAERILQNYNRNVAPDHTDVKIQFRVQRFVGLDIETGILTLDIWFEMQWDDNRLQWDPEEFDGRTSVTLSADSVWIPDISLYNSPKVFMSFDNRARVVVHSVGAAVYMPPTEINSFCDTSSVSPCSPNVTCPLKFASWMYTQDQVDLDVLIDSGLVDQSPEFRNREWSFVEETHRRNVISYICCAPTNVDVTYNLTLTHNYS